MAQRRAVSIGSTVFDYKLYIIENDEPNNINTEVSTTEAQMHVIWQAEMLTPYITLTSKEHGWIKQATKDALISQYSLLETTFILSYDDGTTDNVRFAQEKGISFVPLSEGCDIYTTQINLAKVL
jgi:hypothetical protein